jgi:hypothetical protein
MATRKAVGGNMGNATSGAVFAAIKELKQKMDDTQRVVGRIDQVLRGSDDATKLGLIHDIEVCKRAVQEADEKAALALHKIEEREKADAASVIAAAKEATAAMAIAKDQVTAASTVATSQRGTNAKDIAVAVVAGLTALAAAFLAGGSIHP